MPDTCSLGTGHSHRPGLTDPGLYRQFLLPQEAGRCTLPSIGSTETLPSLTAFGAKPKLTEWSTKPFSYSFRTFDRTSTDANHPNHPQFLFTYRPFLTAAFAQVVLRTLPPKCRSVFRSKLRQLLVSQEGLPTHACLFWVPSRCMLPPLMNTSSFVTESLPVPPTDWVFPGGQT